MSNKKRKKLDKLRPLKGRVRGKAYVGDEMKKMDIQLKELGKQVDSLSRQRDSLQRENDSLKQVIKIKL